MKTCTGQPISVSAACSSVARTPAGVPLQLRGRAARGHLGGAGQHRARVDSRCSGRKQGGGRQHREAAPHGVRHVQREKTVVLGEFPQGTVPGRGRHDEALPRTVRTQRGFHPGPRDQEMGHGLGGRSGLADHVEAGACGIQAAEQGGDGIGIRVVHEVEPGTAAARGRVQLVPGRGQQGVPQRGRSERGPADPDDDQRLEARGNRRGDGPGAYGEIAIGGKCEEPHLAGSPARCQRRVSVPEARGQVAVQAVRIDARPRDDARDRVGKVDCRGGHATAPRGRPGPRRDRRTRA